MGQKIHPVGFRVGVIRGFDSQWYYNKKGYGPALLQEALAVDAVDTTGAGDCFTGALAQALAGGADLAGAVRYAVAAAALSTTGPGARGALPCDDDVRAVLDRVPPATEVG